MIFKKKNKKLDPKVRFQHKQFTGKLQTARSYKRTAAAIPETKFEKFLSRIGLGSKWAQIGLGLVVLAIVYVLYFPNFLTVQRITITGLSESQARDLEFAVRDQIANTNFFYPAKNLVFLRPATVEQAVDNVPSVAKIAHVSRNLRNQELTIQAESKYEKFLVATPTQVFDVYNDGTIKGTAGVSRDQWEGVSNSAMVKIELFSEVEDSSKQFLYPDVVKYLASLQEALSQIPNVQVAYYRFKQSGLLEQPVSPAASIEGESAEQIIEKEKPAQPAVPDTKLQLPINSAEVHAVLNKNNTQNSYRVIFDSTKEVTKSVENLKMLLSQTTSDRLAQLSYIDLRLEERAYLCLQNTPCDKLKEH